MQPCRTVVQGCSAEGRAGIPTPKEGGGGGGPGPQLEVAAQSRPGSRTGWALGRKQLEPAPWVVEDEAGANPCGLLDPSLPPHATLTPGDLLPREQEAVVFSCLLRLFSVSKPSAPVPPPGP